MEDYEMKNGTATTTYEVGDTEQVINPTEDNDLVQIGYKPELEVLRSICCYTEETCLHRSEKIRRMGYGWLLMHNHGQSLGVSWSTRLFFA
jgi:hypothetical protein